MGKRFENQVAIVTGGSEGIGFGISKALASEGALVYIVARTKEKLEKAQEQIKSSGGKAEIRVGDITQKGSVEDIIEQVYNENKRLDIVVNNAGAYKPITINDDFSKVEEMINLDMMAPYRISFSLVKRFQNIQQKLKILTVASQASVKVFPDGLGYGVAKTALVSGLLHLEKELKERRNNIEFYRLYPGTVATEKMIPLIKEGKLQNPITLESVVNTALDLLSEKTPSRDVYIGYSPGIGIERIYLEYIEENGFNTLKVKDIDVIDNTFNPSKF